MNAELLSYSRNKGLFAGIDLDGTSVSQNSEDTELYYGRPHAFESDAEGRRGRAAGRGRLCRATWRRLSCEPSTTTKSVIVAPDARIAGAAVTGCSVLLRGGRGIRHRAPTPRGLNWCLPSTMREKSNTGWSWPWRAPWGAAARAGACCLAAALPRPCTALLGRLRRVGERNLELALPELPSRERSRSCAASIAILAGSWWSSAAWRAIRAQNTQDWIRTEGLEHYLAARGARQRRADAHRPPRRVGAVELLSLADGPPDGHGDPAARQPAAGRLCERDPLPARNRVLHKDDFARGLLTAMRGRDGRHPDGHQHDAAAGRVCGVFRRSRRARRPGWRGWRSRRVRLCCPASCCGSRTSRSTCCASGRSWNLRARRCGGGYSGGDATVRGRHWSSGSGAILTSGCGFTGAGRRGRRASRAYIETAQVTNERIGFIRRR